MKCPLTTLAIMLALVLPTNALKVKGVRLGSGKGNPQAGKSKAATVAALAEQCGVSERTARSWVKAAREHETLPNRNTAAHQ